MIVIANASVPPGESIAGAGILYVQNGALKYLGSNGSDTNYRAGLGSPLHAGGCPVRILKRPEK